jgi:UDP-glucose 4-epimerase
MDSQGLAGKRVLVTGGTGFIGQHLLNRLTQVDARIYAVSRSPRHESSGNVHWYQGDLAELSTSRELLKSIRPHVIFHLAGHAVGARTVDAIVPTLQCNLMTTVNLLTAAREFGCGRFILSGSQEEPIGSSELVPSSPYAVTKWASSAYARMFSALYQLPIVILRIFMVYGPGQRNLQKLIPYVTLSLRKGEVPKLMSGDRPVDWIYVDDVVEALLASARVRNLDGKTIDIGSGKLVTVRKVVEKLVQLTGRDITPAFGAKSERPFEQIRVADTKVAEELLRWHPRVALDEGLKRTVAWYEECARVGGTEQRDCFASIAF